MAASLSESFGMHIDEAYRPLAFIYFAFTSIWIVSASCWIINTYKNRHFQVNSLQWTLAYVPCMKSLQLMLSSLFWYSCFYLRTCSLWMSFGVYITGVLFQSVSFVSFMLIAHGYCITSERLSVSERRTTAALGCVFYLILVGHRASVPYFSILLVLGYLLGFYVIFHHISENLILLCEQLNFIEDEDLHVMHDAVYIKYNMFKKFQGAMHILAVAEIVVFINVENSMENYWIRLFIREWAQFCIFLYIGWIFRSQDMAPRFSVMPTIKPKGEGIVPPIYSIDPMAFYMMVGQYKKLMIDWWVTKELDAASFKDLSSHEWQIGVPTSSHNGVLKDSILVVIQHPHASRSI